MITKFEIRIIERLVDRLNKNGLDAVLEYGVAACGGNPQVTRSVLGAAPEPLKAVLISFFAAKRAKKKLVAWGALVSVIEWLGLHQFHVHA